MTTISVNEDEELPVRKKPYLHHFEKAFESPGEKVCFAIDSQ